MSSRSISATERPPAAQRPATVSPAGPPPTTTTSTSSVPAASCMSGPLHVGLDDAGRAERGKRVIEAVEPGNAVRQQASQPSRVRGLGDGEVAYARLEMLPARVHGPEH